MAIEIIRVETKARLWGIRRKSAYGVTLEKEEEVDEIVDRLKFVLTMNGRPLLTFDDYDSAEATAKHLHEKWKAGEILTHTLLSLDTTPTEK